MTLTDSLNSIYTLILSPIPANYKIFFDLLLYTLIIVLYAMFIWKFYRLLSKRDLIKLNLNQYNTTEHPFFSKFLAAVFFLLEYIIILPFLVFFWFVVLSAFILVLSKAQGIDHILVVAVAIIAATRMASYYSEDLSKDLAKMIPFTLLGIFLIDPDFFSVSELIDKVLEIPNLLNHIFMFLVFVLVLEVIMRAIYTVTDFFSSSSEESKVREETGA
ncbi:hypothetical protein COV15_00580 [Candidatus Woesearchaeota archaeon CG10_big_fil_rev_8_21_14_0_10_34_12]|nr:MAG: hypothetical protein COV15_00580 [Candidatus Woesearchaeota archaeon CG10_big_fil_rev_8_21_14_0_10_34_12]